MPPQLAQKRLNLRECHNYRAVDGKQFKTVKSADTMLLEGL